LNGAVLDLDADKVKGYFNTQFERGSEHEKHMIKYFYTLILLFFIVLLGGCVSPSDPNTVECYVIRKICYRGNHPDRFATRERFGVEGVIAIDQGHNRSR